MLKWWLVVAMAGLLGCSKGELPRVACHTPCSIQFVVRVDPTFSTDEQRQLWTGMRTWTRATEGATCFYPQGYDGGEGYNLVIVRGETQESLRPYLDTWKKAAALYKDGSIIVAMDASKHDVPGIMAHETGHALGLRHASDTQAIMHANKGSLINGDLPPIDKDAFVNTRCR